MSSQAEFDDMLDEPTLREAKVSFWKRHKLRYPAEIIPAGEKLAMLEEKLVAEPGEASTGHQETLICYRSTIFGHF